MELQEHPLRAPPPIRRDEGALAPVTPPDRALDRPGHIAREARRRADAHVYLIRLIRLGTDRPTRPWLRRQAEFLVLDVLEQQGEGTVEQDARVAVRDLAAQQRLEFAELLARRLADGELDSIALGSRGLDDGTRASRGWAGRAPIVATGSEGTLIATWVAGENVAGVAAESFRTTVGASGRGASVATRMSISSRVPRLAFSRTAWWFCGVRYRPRRRTEVSVISPDASRSRIIGKRRHARAASMRLHAASSERRSAWAQYAWRDP
jgi:hypothetical protein